MSNGKTPGESKLLQVYTPKFNFSSIFSSIKKSNIIKVLKVFRVSMSLLLLWTK